VIAGMGEDLATSSSEGGRSVLGGSSWDFT
jgi:hypothetical protein